MDYELDASEPGGRRTSVIGAITIVALLALFILAIMARGRNDISLVIVAPAGTVVSLDGEAPRRLPTQPNTSGQLSSFHFVTTPGSHEVSFQERGRPRRAQTIELAAARLPVIFTLLRDTLRELQSNHAE